VLFVRTYAARVGEDKGFDSANLATVEISRRRDAAGSAQDLDLDVLARLRAHPAVRVAARSEGLPPYQRGGSASYLWIAGQSSPAGQVAFRTFGVDPDTFDAMGVDLRSGRGIRAGDTGDQVVVDEAFARRFWPAGDAVGGRFSLGREREPGRTVYEIVGVASRVRLDAADAPMGGAFHVMHRAIASDAAPLTFVARLASPQALGEVTAALRDVAGDAVVRLGWMDDRYAETYGGARIAAGLTGGFGLIAVSVAMVGLYGVTAFLVAGRTREIGIRLALGADRRHVRRLVTGPAMRSVAIGAGTGTVAAFFAARLIEGQLVGVTSADPWTYLGIIAVIAVTALVATWRPAHRAARIDPAIALRGE